MANISERQKIFKKMREVDGVTLENLSKGVIKISFEGSVWLHHPSKKLEIVENGTISKDIYYMDAKTFLNIHILKTFKCKKNAFKTWTEDDQSEINRLVSQNLSITAIAEKIHRGINSEIIRRILGCFQNSSVNCWDIERSNEIWLNKPINEVVTNISRQKQAVIDKEYRYDDGQKIESNNSNHSKKTDDLTDIFDLFFL